MSEKMYIAFPFDEVAGNNAEEYFAFDERVEILGAIYTNKDTITANNTDYMTFGVQNGAGTKTYFKWVTQVTGEGTISALTPAPLVAGADQDEAIIEANTCIKVHSTKGGAGKALDGSLVVVVKKARAY